MEKGKFSSNSDSFPIDRTLVTCDTDLAEAVLILNSFRGCPGNKIKYLDLDTIA
jgi:hypothetical protein